MSRAVAPVERAFRAPDVGGAALPDAIAERVADLILASPADDHSLRSYRPRSAEAYFLQLGPGPTSSLSLACR